MKPYQKEWQRLNVVKKRGYEVKWKKLHPERSKALFRNAKLKQFFGLTLDDFNEMLKLQRGVCYICGGTDRQRSLNVDHNHTTGAIRKLICSWCNFLVGAVENRDHRGRLNKVIDYVKEFSDGGNSDTETKYVPQLPTRKN